MEFFEHQAHVLAHREFSTGDVVVLDQSGPFQDVAPGLLQVSQVYLGEAGLQRLFDEHLGLEKIPTQLGQRIQAGRRQFHLLVFQQAAHQLGARVFGFLALGHLARRQQHA